MSDEQTALHSPVGSLQTLCWCGRSALEGSGEGKGSVKHPVRRREPCPPRRAAGRSGGRRSWPSGGTGSSRTWQVLGCWWRRCWRLLLEVEHLLVILVAILFIPSLRGLFPSGGNSKWKKNNTFPEAQCSLGCDGVLRWGTLFESTTTGSHSSPLLWNH